ncbi:MAG TPA: condensation domain-containing protein, partial [Longimicrobiaceae bacterium]|nr:condensation domain-containing protein [Longimicrobiaceae bacterium]
QGLKLTPRQLFERPTVARLAEVVERMGSAATAQAQEPVTGEAPLTPIQHRFLELPLPAQHHFNQALLLVPRDVLDAGLLVRAAAALQAHHDALRLRFRRDESGAWRQSHAGVGGRAPLTVFELSGLPEEARQTVIEAAAEQVQRSLELARGPLLRMAYFDLGAGRAGRLLVVIHHLAVDGVSWRILLDDLENAYTQLSRGEVVRLPAKTTAWKAWAERLAEHARSEALGEEVAYWAGQTQRQVAALPVDDPAAESTASRSRSVAVHLSEEDTGALLREVPQAYRTRIDEVLLTALAAALGRWTGERRVRIDLEGHGREEEAVGGADLSRTVGWFTSVYPVVLELPETREAGAALKAVKEQLRAVPNHGIGYGLLRYVGGSEAAAELGRAADPEVAFNYLGQFDQSVSEESFFAFAEESAGASADGRSPRQHLLEVSGSVRGRRLELLVGYAEGVHRRETVERLAEGLAGELRELIAHCSGAGAGGYTPSDFPLARLEQAELDALLGSERGVEDVYPLTPMQEGMLFHTLNEEGLGTYVGQMVVTLRGALDASAFMEAWQGALDRHAALRTRFAWERTGRPLQVVVGRAVPEFLQEDWRGYDEAEQRSRMQAYLVEDRRRGVDVSRAPLMRLVLFRTGEERFELVWTHHHLILDGWSLPLLFRDVVALYDGHAQGRPVQLGSVRPPRDYVAWLAQQDLARAEQAWRDTLAGFAAPTPLPLEGGARLGADAGPGRSGHGEARVRLGEERTARLQAFARAQGLTPNTMLQGAWGLLLARHSGEEDVVFGATVSGRPPQLPGVEGMVGLFINTVPVRARVRPEARVGEWLADLQARQVALREHEHAPLVQLRRWSEISAGQPLFESVFAFANYPVDPALAERDAGFRVESARIIERDDYPLFLGAGLHKGVLDVDLVYHRSRYPAALAERLLEQLRTLLDQLVADPRRRIAEVTGLTAAERERVLAVGHGGAAEYPRGQCVHDLISRRAAAAPDAAAVISGGLRLSFADLEERADRLAARLLSHGAGPEERVAILLDRSADLAVALLGVLRAGGAYVPLDPAYPPERLAYLLADSGARVVVTRSGLAAALPATAAATLLVDADDSPAAPGSASDVDPDNAAYIVYTSGSTGKPKGVVVSHRSLVCYAEAARAELGLGAEDRFLQFASPSFDVMVEEIFPAWLSGAAVVFPEHDLLESPEALLEVVEAQGVTGFELPTAFWHEWVRMLAEEGRRLPASLRFVIVGGERV